MARHSKQGLSLVEVIIGFFVIAAAGAVLFTSLSSSHRFSGMTRNRTAATMIASNFMEEVKAHNYGEAAPKTWPEVTTETSPPDDWDSKYDADANDPNYANIPMLSYGKPVRLVFYRQLRLENGSFVDSSIDEKTDKVTLVVWWQEITAAKDGQAFKSLEVELGVRSPW